MLSPGTNRSDAAMPGKTAMPLHEEDGNRGLEGYDFEFVPSLDDKHMCPICLMALRDPVQTACGHRFCQPCITRSLEIKRKCPVDNAPLHPNQLFQDKYARREVLDLSTKCPNKGCNHTCELRRMESHMESCPMRKYPCKNKCGISLLKQDAVYHEENQCPKRPVSCHVCGQTYPLDSEESHKEECKQHQIVNCPHCKYELKRYKLQTHITTECLQAPIKCVFEKVGCPYELPRHDIQKHMVESTQIHLQFVLSSVSQVSKSNTDFSSLLEALATRVKALEPNDSLYDTNNSIEIYGGNDQMMTNGNGNIPRCAGFLSQAAGGSPLGSSSDDDDVTRTKLRNQRMNINMDCSTSQADPPTAPSRSENPVLSTDIEERIISLDHHVRELMAKMEGQISGLKELTGRVNTVEQRMSQQELKCCNGLYFWKIREYSRLRKAAATGEVSVLHSPGFYTSPHGYRLCIRVNLDGVETAQGTHLSLFVHLMKGENDELLSWPFQGVITLTVVNQRDLPQERSHISETLLARTNLMAFQRPTSERNQKGYGYIDFFPLNMIEREGFIKNDTLVIKAQVRVDASANINANNGPNV